MPGSGKSYNAVSQQIIPALKEGRTVVTNVPLHVEKLQEKYPHGSVVEFPLQKVMQNPDSIREYVTAGCVFVLDEVWRIWPAGDKANKIAEAYKSLLAEHRHMVGEVVNPQTGHKVKVSTQIVLVVQDAGNMAAFARKLAEQTFIHTKLGHVGSDQSFRVDIFHGPVTGTVVSPAGANFIRSTFGRYSEDVWQFYKSHTMSQAATEGASEKAVDRRGSALRRPIFILMPIMLAGGIFALWYVLHDVTHWGQKSEESVVKITGKKPGDPVVVPASQTTIGQMTHVPSSVMGILPAAPPKLLFKVVGHIKSEERKDQDFMILEDAEKKILKRSMQHCRTVDDGFVECEVAGTFYGEFGGSLASQAADKALAVSAPVSAPRNYPLAGPSASASPPAVGGPGITATAPGVASDAGPRPGEIREARLSGTAQEVRR